MQDGTQDNAMTEVALALAMGFFSILVLALVSMGAGRVLEPQAASTPPPAVISLTPSQAAARTPVPSDAPDTLVIYHAGRFYDAELRPLDPAGLAAEGRVVLAFAPDLPLSEVMAAQARITAPNLVASTLNGRWQAALASLDGTAGARP